MNDKKLTAKRKRQLEYKKQIEKDQQLIFNRFERNNKEKTIRKVTPAISKTLKYKKSE